MASQFIENRNPLEKILTVTGRVASLIISKLSPVFGFDIEIYEPLTQDSGYGSSTNDSTFSSTPTVNRYAIITGLIVERLTSDASLDPYNSQEILLYLEREYSYMRGSKVVVHLKTGRQLFFRTEDTRELSGLDSPLFRKIVLVPMEASIPQAPEIIQPVAESIAIPVGDKVKLSPVITEHARNSYQWVKDEAVIPGATSNVLEIDSVGEYAWEIEVECQKEDGTPSVWVGRKLDGDTPIGRYMAVKTNEVFMPFVDITDKNE